MKLKKVNPQEFGQLLYEIDNSAFNRDFDIPARDINEEVNYLKDSDVFIAYEDTIPIGIVAYLLKNDTVEIRTIAVIPQYQGRGLGKQILSEILDLVKGKKVQLVTHPKNIPGIIVYLKLGFEIHGWKDNYYGDGEPRLLLKLE